MPFIMNNLAIIPARGGSKRIPRKNIKDFLGRPIIAYSIEVALKSSLFSEVMVSTDDEEIAAIAGKYGAVVPFLRSKKNSDDYATTMDVIGEVLENYRNKFDKAFEYSCCIYPTAPFITQEDLKEGFLKITSTDLKSVFPVVEFDTPIWRGLAFDENENIKMLWKEYQNSRSQDLKKVYHDAGQWYWINPNIIGNDMYSDNSKCIIISREKVQDIDTMTDWRLAELKYGFIYNT